jgi:hypothetical protein
VARRLVIGILALVVVAAVVMGGTFLWLRRAQLLPAQELSKIEVQVEAEKGFVRAHVYDGSSYNLQDVTVRVFAFRPMGGYGSSAEASGWQIASSRCTSDPVTRPPDGYDLVFDRQTRFATSVKPLGATVVNAASDFVPGADYWECRIVGANGYK